MLNRRILRIKVMQTLYAYKQAEGADYQLALDQIDEAFAPDLNAPEPPDLNRLEGSRQLSRVLFEEHYLASHLPPDEDASVEVRKAVNNALVFFHTQRKKDAQQLQKQMVAETEKIFDRYLLVLLLLTELAEYARQEEDERQHKRLVTEPGVSERSIKLNRNKVIGMLRDNTALHSEVVRRGLGWGAHWDFVKRLYKEAVKKDPDYQAYQQLPEATFEEDQKIVDHLVKQIVFKHELADTFFEELDLSWPENSDIVKSMVRSTIKGIEAGKPASVELRELSRSWEDDRQFFIDLYKYTLDNDLEYEKIVSEKAKNWDVERIASLDKIILKMAMAEMLHFPSIPVKVTINEYIELSKGYSTPKSKQFVNGLLDAIAADLTASGALRKSGRGLIDNR